MIIKIDADLPDLNVLEGKICSEYLKEQDLNRWLCTVPNPHGSQMGCSTPSEHFISALPVGPVKELELREGA